MRRVYLNWDEILDDITNIRKRFGRSFFVKLNTSFFKRHPTYREFEKSHDLTTRERSVFSGMKQLWKEIAGGQSFNSTYRVEY